MRKANVFLLLVIVCFVITSCGKENNTIKTAYLEYLEDVDYMYIIPSSEVDNWEHRISVSRDQLIENKGIPISFSDFHESENDLYNIRFHSIHYYFIDFYEVRLTDKDSLFLWPIDDDHPTQILTVTHFQGIPGMPDKLMDSYEAVHMVYEF